MTAITMYLFGDNHPEIAALIRDHDFQALVQELFLDDLAPTPADPPPAFESAVRLNLLSSNDGGTYGAGQRLSVIPASAERDLPEVLRPTLAPYVEIADETAAELRLAYEETEANKRFKWNQVCHSVIAGMFLGLAMGVEIFRSGRAPHRPAGDTAVWAFQSVSAKNAYGVQWTSCPGRTLFAQLWHRRARRNNPRLSPALVEGLLRVARGEAVDRSSKELLYLRHLGFLRTMDSRLQLQVPFFGPADTERLLEPLSQGARRLVEDSIIPALENLSFHPWWREKARDDHYRHAAVRLMLEYGTDCVIGSKVLPAFPEPQDLPVEWGHWLWEEREGSRTLMPSIAMDTMDQEAPTRV